MPSAARASVLRAAAASPRASQLACGGPRQHDRELRVAARDSTPAERAAAARDSTICKLQAASSVSLFDTAAARAAGAPRRRTASAPGRARRRRSARARMRPPRQVRAALRAAAPGVRQPCGLARACAVRVGGGAAHLVRVQSKLSCQYDRSAAERSVPTPMAVDAHCIRQCCKTFTGRWFQQVCARQLRVGRAARLKVGGADESRTAARWPSPSDDCLCPEACFPGWRAKP